MVSYEISTDFPGVVTRFLVELLPAPKVFRSSGYIFAKAQFLEVFNWVIGLKSTLDEDTEISAVCNYPDGSDEVCFMVSFITMKDNDEAASNALLPAHETRPKGAIQEWFCQEDSLEKEYGNILSIYPGSRRWFADNAFINDADMAAVLEKVCLSLPDRHCVVLWYPLAPQSHRQLPEMAFSLQSDHYIGTYAICASESDDEKCRSWVRETAKKMEPFRTGSFSGETDFQFRIAKLTGIQQRWDPDGRMCGPPEEVGSSAAN